MTATPNPPGGKTAGQPFTITRTFNAPRPLVWQAWTERDRLAQWFGPKGITVTAATLDFRPCGSYHYCMRTPDGHDMWGKFVYRQIDAPKRLEWINSFSDAAGGITRHPMAPNWPLELLSVATFEDLGGKTKLTIQWSPHNATPAECALFDSMYGSMNQGWSGTFERFDDYLAKK
jgi:uncharacterized protein YndB with AHSA1/START domain